MSTGNQPLPELKPGIWRHRKGGLYRVLGYARVSTNGPGEGAAVVVYASLDPGGAGTGPRMYVRDAGEFLARFTCTGTGVPLP